MSNRIVDAMRWRLWVGVTVVLLSLSGCAGILIGGAATGVGLVHDRRTAGTMMDDQSLELKLYDLLSKQLPSDTHIGVTAYNGTVLLTGQVPSAAARQQADAIVRNFTPPPVRMLHNELSIAAPSSLSVQSNDAFLTAKVKAALLKINQIPDFDPTRVKVVTERGIVYLFGLVRQMEADAAADVASQVGGVRQVVTLFEYIP